MTLVLVAGLLALALAVPVLGVGVGQAGAALRARRLAASGLAWDRPSEPGVVPGAATLALARLGRLGRRLSSAERDEATGHLLARAGDRWRVEHVHAARAAGAVFVVLAAAVLVPAGAPGLFVLAVLGWAAFAGPSVYLHALARRRAEAIGRSLSDSLDLLAISVEAGAGLEGAMAKVVDGLDGPLADEYRRALHEMQMGVSRREALLRMKDRLDMPEVSSFVLAVVQADTMGMAMGRILKTQAQEMRARRRRRAREQAAKTPVKILFPLVFGIFPSMLVVILGPAAIRILEMLATR